MIQTAQASGARSEAQVGHIIRPHTVSYVLIGISEDIIPPGQQRPAVAGGDTYHTAPLTCGACYHNSAADS